MEINLVRQTTSNLFDLPEDCCEYVYCKKTGRNRSAAAKCRSVPKQASCVVAGDGPSTSALRHSTTAIELPAQILHKTRQFCLNLNGRVRTGWTNIVDKSVILG